MQCRKLISIRTASSLSLTYIHFSPTHIFNMYATCLPRILLVTLCVICIAQASRINIHNGERRLVHRQDSSSGATPNSAVAAQPSVTQAEPDSATAAAPTEDDTQETTSEAEASPTAEPTVSESEPKTTAQQPDETTAVVSSPTDAATSKASQKSTTAAQPSQTEASSQAADDETITTSAAAAASSDEDSAASSTAAPETTTAASNSGSDDESNSSASSAADDEASTTAEDNEVTETATLVTSTFIDVVTRTNSDGSRETMTTTTKTTSTPDLNSSDSNNSSSMSTKTRNTVIGVVVGVGGAIVLGGLALVAWRIWGRKKHNEEADGLMDYGERASRHNNSDSIDSSYAGAEKVVPGTVGSSGSGPQRSPFQQTLENYHQPTPVNASSNF